MNTCEIDLRNVCFSKILLPNLRLILYYMKKKKKENKSNNVNEVIKTILDFFIQKFHKHKKHETLTVNKNKKCA